MVANGVEIDFVAGHGDAPADVPPPIRQALLLLIAHWYEHREPVEIGATKSYTGGVFDGGDVTFTAVSGAQHPAAIHGKGRQQVEAGQDEIDHPNNPVDHPLSNLQDIFLRVLCDTTSIDNIHGSNHTLEGLFFTHQTPSKLPSLLNMNNGSNKSHVAIKKILLYHPNIDMEPLFEWNVEGEGERDLKALPYVIAWFERAREAIADDEEGGSYNIDEIKLSTIYQFAKAMPLMFVTSG